MFVAIVPIYNEEKHIGQVIKELKQVVDLVVVVDDASQDQSVRIAKQAGAVVLEHEVNLGQGAALETGHEYARYLQADYVLHFDGDGQFDVKDIKPAWQALKRAQADILFGSKFLTKQSQVPFFKKYFLLPIGKTVDSFFSGLKLKDLHNGFRILNKKALSCLRLEQNRMAHATEIPQLTKKFNLKYIEFPVKVIYHEYGQSMFNSFNIIKDLLIDNFTQK